MIARLLMTALAAATLTAQDSSAPDQPQAGTAEPIFVDHVEGTKVFVTMFGADDAVATDADTVITLGGKPATLADLRKGDHITKLLAAGGKATSMVVVREKAADDQSRAK
jgi:hypothetical protein